MTSDREIKRSVAILSICTLSSTGNRHCITSAGFLAIKDDLAKTEYRLYKYNCNCQIHVLGLISNPLHNSTTAHNISIFQIKRKLKQHRHNKRSSSFGGFLFQLNFLGFRTMLLCCFLGPFASMFRHGSSPVSDYMKNAGFLSEAGTLVVLYRRTDSNRGLEDYDSSALPTELRRQHSDL